MTVDYNVDAKPSTTKPPRPRTPEGSAGAGFIVGALAGMTFAVVGLKVSWMVAWVVFGAGLVLGILVGVMTTPHKEDTR